MHVRVIRSIVTLSALALASACATELAPPCSQVGADEGLTVYIDVNGVLPPDFYTTTVFADGQVRSTTSAIQLGDPGYGHHADLAATSATPDGKHLEVVAGLDNTSGSAEVWYDEGGGPAQVSIEISNSTGVIAHADFTPTYLLFEPNGPDCLPHAHVALASMTITP